MWGMQVIVQFFAIKTFDGAIKLDLHLFLKWITISFAGWLVYFLICMLESYCRARAIKAMNSDLKMIFTRLYTGEIQEILKEKKELNTFPI